MYTTSNILESNPKIVTQAQRSAYTSAAILQYLDVIAERFGEIIFDTKKITFKIESPDLAFAVRKSQPVDLYLVGSQTKTGRLRIGFKDMENGTFLASAKIPQYTFKNKSQIVYSFLFRNDLLFQTGKVQIQLSSKILAVSVGKEKIENLTSLVQLTFKKDVTISDNESSIFENVCTFWDSEMCKFTKL